MSSAAPDAGDEAIVLCGGLGTRLRPVLADRPKALAEVGGRPFLEWLLLALAAQGVRRPILATGHLAHLVEAGVGDGARLGVRIRYSREAEPLGTAGALRLAATLTPAPTLAVLNGDTYCRFDLAALRSAHRARAALATLWLEPVEDGGRFGTVELEADGRISGFREKAGGGGRPLASAGVYLVERSVVDRVPAGRPASLERDVFPALAGRGLFGVRGRGGFVDIGTPESLAGAGQALRQELGALERETWNRA